jgi:predicted nuclease with RNAse H fold
MKYGYQFFINAIRRKLKLLPIHHVLKELRRRGIRLETMNALEIYGHTGAFHTKHYAPYVRTLEVWEIDPACEAPLKQNLPNAKVKIVDSYEEIKSTSNKYHLIMIDNPMSTFNERCEHFDLFPDIFRVMKGVSILVLNIIPEIDDTARQKYPYLFNHVQLERRKMFYQTVHPENVPIDDMVKIYKKYIEENCFNMEWHFCQRRNFVWYLVIKVRRNYNSLPEENTYV